MVQLHQPFWESAIIAIAAVLFGHVLTELVHRRREQRAKAPLPMHLYEIERRNILAERPSGPFRYWRLELDVFNASSQPLNIDLQLDIFGLRQSSLARGTLHVIPVGRGTQIISMTAITHGGRKPLIAFRSRIYNLPALEAVTCFLYVENLSVSEYTASVEPLAGHQVVSLQVLAHEHCLIRTT